MKAASNRTLSLALTVSLAINLFLAGALVGGWLGGGAATTTTAVPGPSVAEFAATLPPDGWTALDESMRRHRADVQARVAALNTARDAVARALARHPLDPRAVQAAFAGLRRASQEVQAALHGALGEMVGGMSPRDRAYMARSLFLFSAPDNAGIELLDGAPTYRVPLM